jgi:hypothetical protein
MSDSAYYRERAAAERAKAEAAKDGKIAAIHNELADRYDELAKRGEPHSKLRIAGTADTDSAE